MPSAILLIAQLLPLIPGLIRGVTGTISAFNEGTALLEKIVSENRDPTPEEWDAWSARVKKAHDAIQSA